MGVNKQREDKARGGEGGTGTGTETGQVYAADEDDRRKRMDESRCAI